jgi:membrane-bound lytic murein transglycosylase D
MRLNVILLVVLGFLLLGCSGTRRFLWLPDRAQSVQNEENASQVTSEFETPAYLLPQERLNEVLSCYDQALDSASAKRNVAAQRLFETSIVKLSELRADSLEVNQDLDHLGNEIIANYAKFLNQLPDLPAETSPTAVYLSLSEFLGDSVESWEDLIDIVLSPEDGDAVYSDSQTRSEAYPDIPLVVNSYVEEAVIFFQTKAHKVFTKWLERSEVAVPYFAALLKEEGMPEELVYLSMIESGFSNIAYSRAAASGPWQFISSTAKIYGLNVGKYYDERRDPDLSTRAACRYLKKLYDQFGDWYLAFASYNCGERRVEKIVQRTGNNDYWQIRQHLPKQTRDYVPYYLAARLICQDPERYGFVSPTFREPIESGVVYVDGCVDLKVIAKCAEADYDELKSLNPALKKGCTPPNSKNFPIRLPSGTGQNFSEKFTQVPAKQRYQTPKQEKGDWVRHRVRKGETLAVIAKRYGVSVESISLISANKVSNPHKLRVGQYLLIPVRGEYIASSKEPEVGKPQPPRLTSEDGRNRTIYTVRRGDTLAEIGVRFGVQSSDIKTWNHLFGERYIHPGQKLILWCETDADQSRRHSETLAVNEAGDDSPDSPHVYKIRPGDTLWDIAKRTGISVQNLKKWNDIRSAYKLMPGSELKLQP